ncbi:MAG: DUF2442 domain-containing protein [Nodosilinea sp.]
MFLHVKGLEYLEAYKLRLTFSNQVVQDIDLAKELYGEVFEPLQDPQQFRQVFLNSDTNTIEWPNGADFAPEFLYKLGQSTSQRV